MNSTRSSDSLGEYFAMDSIMSPWGYVAIVVVVGAVVLRLVTRGDQHTSIKKS